MERINYSQMSFRGGEIEQNTHRGTHTQQYYGRKRQGAAGDKVLVCSYSWVGVVGSGGLVGCWLSPRQRPTDHENNSTKCAKLKLSAKGALRFGIRTN